MEILVGIFAALYITVILSLLAVAMGNTEASNTITILWGRILGRKLIVLTHFDDERTVSWIFGKNTTYVYPFTRTGYLELGPEGSIKDSESGFIEKWEYY